MERQKVIISEQLEKVLTEAVATCHADRSFILTDETTLALCWPIVQNYPCLKDAKPITSKAGDTKIWNPLVTYGANCNAWVPPVTLYLSIWEAAW